MKDNLEIYFAMGDCDVVEDKVCRYYCAYKTPEHSDGETMTSTNGLKNILGEILSSIPESYYFQPQYIDEINTDEKLRLEKILGRKISREAFVTYCTREQYEQEQRLTMR